MNSLQLRIYGLLIYVKSNIYSKLFADLVAPSAVLVQTDTGKVQTRRPLIEYDNWTWRPLQWPPTSIYVRGYWILTRSIGSDDGREFVEGPDDLATFIRLEVFDLYQLQVTHFNGASLLAR